MNNSAQIDIKTAVYIIALIFGGSFAGNVGGGVLSDKVTKAQLDIAIEKVILKLDASASSDRHRLYHIENHLERNSDFRRITRD